MGRCRETDKENQVDVKAEADVGAAGSDLEFQCFGLLAV